MSIHVDSRQLELYLAACQALARQPEPMLRRIGIYYVGETKRVFTRAPWPPKPEHWAYWEGHKRVPLTYRGRLGGSITYDIPGGHTLRVGSPLKYAPTHQFGDDRERHFSVYLIPELEPGARGGLRIARFASGYPKGRLTLKQEFTGESPLSRKAQAVAEKRSGVKAGGYEAQAASGGRLLPGVIRVRITGRVRKRPFLLEPSSAQWAEIGRICQAFLAGGRA